MRARFWVSAARARERNDIVPRGRGGAEPELCRRSYHETQEIHEIQREKVRTDDFSSRHQLVSALGQLPSWPTQSFRVFRVFRGSSDCIIPAECAAARRY